MFKVDTKDIETIWAIFWSIEIQGLFLLSLCLELASNENRRATCSKLLSALSEFCCFIISNFNLESVLPARI